MNVGCGDYRVAAFTGLILTRNVAETVLLSQIQKKLREDNIDVDSTIDALHKCKNMKAPDKVKEGNKLRGAVGGRVLHKHQAVGTG